MRKASFNVNCFRVRSEEASYRGRAGRSSKLPFVKRLTIGSCPKDDLLPTEWRHSSVGRALHRHPRAHGYDSR